MSSQGRVCGLHLQRIKMISVRFPEWYPDYRTLLGFLSIESP